MEKVKEWLSNAVKSIQANFLGVVRGYPYTAGIIALASFLLGAWLL